MHSVDTRNIEDIYKLSSMQQGMLFHTLYAPRSAVYFEQMTRVMENLDVPNLIHAWQQVLARHSILRTAFFWEDLDEPLQVVYRQVELPVERYDWRELAPQEQQRRLEAFLKADRQRGFDLSEAPLMRLTLIRMGHTVPGAWHTVVWSYHHLLLDGWSVFLVQNELSAWVEALQQGRTLDLPQPRPFRDYIAWLQRQEVAEAEAFWRRKLEGFITPTPIGIDRAPGTLPGQGENQGEYILSLSDELSHAIQAFARRHHITLNTLVLAAWALLLSHYSGQSDVVFGLSVLGRPLELTGFETMVGLFIHTLPVRLQIPASSSVLSWLNTVQVELAELHRYGYTPLVRIHEWSEIPHGQPMFDSILGFEGALSREPACADDFFFFEKVNYPLAVALKSGDTLRLHVAYDRCRFDGVAIARMSSHFQALLEGMVANPEQWLSDLSLQTLTEAEQHQLLVEWNDTKAVYPHDRCIHELFEAQVERVPDAVAVVFEDRHLTYHMLNCRANQLAHHLQTLGLGPEMLVGIWKDRSPDMVAGLLGVLKAGGAYVPLDSAWPLERVRWILSALDVSCILVDRSRQRAILDVQWSLPHLTHVICMEVDTPEPPPEPLDVNALRAVWDRVAKEAVDRVTAGGFISSYTGQPFSEVDVDEYVKRVVELAQPYLGPGKRVLEIGCGSGLVMFAISPGVGLYVGLDPSEVTQAHNREVISKNDFASVKLLTGFAHELVSMELDSFDLIILASTVQFFPGPIYLKQTLKRALQLLEPGGVVLIADVMDARRKEEFRQSLEAFRRQHHDDADVKTKVQLDRELYFDEDFFFDLAAELGFSEVTILHRREGFENELCYRYDVLLKKVDARDRAPVKAEWIKRKKRFWTGWHLSQHPTDNLSPSATPDGIAYIIHTSGSTGDPKGVVIRHRSVVNLIDWVNKTFRVGPGDRMLFVTSLCFDLSVYDILGLLAAGGSIQVPPESSRRDPAQLLRLLCHTSITFWDSAPAALQQLVPFFPSVKSDWKTDQLRLVFLSGDWIPVTLPDVVRTTFPRAQAIGLGGATEATIWSNYYPVGQVDPGWASIPYGRPIQNAQYYILDSHLNPCPIGVAGDLYIGGECLALGYANQPALTAEKFIPHPFGSTPGGRLYTTGDRARYWPDGNIEFLGRVDHQVKIRGFRIELGEVEAVLGRHPAVRETVVLAREDERRHKRLVAYVVANEGQAPTVSEMDRFLHDKLPEYMVPSAFVMLEGLPLTPNGKVDRRALPPDTVRQTFIAPRTPVEEVLAGIWAEILGVEQVGVHDNFFALGGHSLLATQVVSRVRQVFKEELALRYLFESPTVADLAVMLAKHETVPGQVAAIAQLRKRIAGMSADEIRATLRDKKGAKEGIDG